MVGTVLALAELGTPAVVGIVGRFEKSLYYAVAYWMIGNSRVAHSCSYCFLGTRSWDYYSVGFCGYYFGCLVVGHLVLHSHFCFVPVVVSGIVLRCGLLLNTMSRRLG